MARRDQVVWTRLGRKRKAFIFSVNDMHRDGIPDAIGAMEKALTDGSATRVILDLRYTRGGSTSAMDGLLGTLARNPAINRPGGLVVLIGREDVRPQLRSAPSSTSRRSLSSSANPPPTRADNGLNPSL